MRIAIGLLLVCVIGTPVAAWGVYKPTRVLAPALNGVVCLSDTICTDDPSQYDQAVRLYEDAYEFVTEFVGTIERKPRAIFCVSQSCFLSFGFENAAANTVGVSGIVVGPRGWQNHFMRHEMIHHLQSERIGVLGQWLSPDWFTEGMAYALGRDPRADLGEPMQQYRSMFESWFRSVGMERLWQEAPRR